MPFLEIHLVNLSVDSDESSGAVLPWIIKQLDGDFIEDVTDEILDKLVNGELDGAGTIYCEQILFC